MTFQETMRQLEKLGTAQTRKTYTHHGAGKNTFGVSFANLYRIQKQIKQDHALARRLWKTCNFDAQWLATLIADPAKMSATEVDEWAKDMAHHAHVLGGALAGLVARTPCAEKKMRAWMQSKNELMRASGYDLLTVRLKNGDSSVSNTDCRKILATVEKEIHSSANRARHSMNGAVIGIGVFRRALAKDAMAAARRIGKVEVDHGDTCCKTPEACAYIQKGLKRRK